MNIYKALLLLITPLLQAGVVEPIVIQPYYLQDIYRNQIVDNIPFHITILTFRNFSHDRYEESERYAITSMYTKINPKGNRSVVLLGDAGLNVKYLKAEGSDKPCLCVPVRGVLLPSIDQIKRAFDRLPTKDIYILSDTSSIATLRETQLHSLPDDTVYHKAIVSSETELRAAVTKWNKEPKGVLFINAFDLKADSGKRISYRYIECTVTDFNITHLEVGIYRKEHCAAVAIGYDPADIATLIKEALLSTKTDIKLVSKSSVNVARLNQLNMSDLAIGSFKEANLYEQTPDR